MNSVAREFPEEKYDYYNTYEWEDEKDLIAPHVVTTKHKFGKWIRRAYEQIFRMNFNNADDRQDVGDVVDGIGFFSSDIVSFVSNQFVSLPK